MKKISLEKFTISKLKNLQLVKGGGPDDDGGGNTGPGKTMQCIDFSDFNVPKTQTTQYPDTLSPTYTQ